jgi:hypothetical protein
VKMLGQTGQQPAPAATGFPPHAGGARPMGGQVGGLGIGSRRTGIEPEIRARVGCDLVSCTLKRILHERVTLVNLLATRQRALARPPETRIILALPGSTLPR